MFSNAARKIARTALLGLLLAAPAFAQQHGHDGHSQLMSAAIEGKDYAFSGPQQLTTGYTTLTFKNSGRELHHLQLARLNDGVSLEQFTAALQQGEQAALPLIEFVGGVGMVPPGREAKTTVFLEKPGTYLELCFIPNEAGVPHLALGMMQPLKVVAATAAAPEAPQADLVVDMKDFAYTLPANIPAGKQVWQIVNQGPQPHELMLGKLQAGKTMDDVMAYLEGGSQGAPPIDLMGGAQALSVGNSSFIDFELTPGEYVAICFIPDPATGKPHVALGMLSAFTVGMASASH